MDGVIQGKNGHGVRLAKCFVQKRPRGVFDLMAGANALYGQNGPWGHFEYLLWITTTFAVLL